MSTRENIRLIARAPLLSNLPFVFYVTLFIFCLRYLKANHTMFTLFQRQYFPNITSKSVISNNDHFLHSAISIVLSCIACYKT